MLGAVCVVPMCCARGTRHRALGTFYRRFQLWYFRGSAGGNNSVVECDLAKVEVAGSNPVSRSNFSPGSRGKVVAPERRSPEADSDVDAHPSRVDRLTLLSPDQSGLTSHAIHTQSGAVAKW